MTVSLSRLTATAGLKYLLKTTMQDDLIKPLGTPLVTTSRLGHPKAGGSAGDSTASTGGYFNQSPNQTPKPFFTRPAS
ncbi:hypothetical protein NHF46_00900 [Arthrobacter alpinus]|nr:hypothetical protein [Arthrobacter alpinus]